jgi:hypothetical protein
MKNLLFKLLWNSWLYIHDDIYSHHTKYWWVNAKHLKPKNYSWITPCDSGDKDAWNYHTWNNRRLDYIIRRKLGLSCKRNPFTLKYSRHWANMCEKHESFIRWLEIKLNY